MEKDISHQWKGKKRAGVAVLISNDTDFTVSDIKKDKNRHYIMIKRAIHQEEITIINIYTPNTRTSSYIKQLLIDLRGDIDANTIIVGDFNTPTKQKLNKETIELTQTLEQMDLIAICRTFHRTDTEHLFFFSCTWHFLQD